jgi:hypothetical protein
MARLPQPGSDDGLWGSILNDFLTIEHDTDGSLKIRTDGTFDGFVKTSGAQTVAGVKTFSSSPVVPAPTNGTDAANKTYVDSVAGGGAPDATTTTKGIVQLAGDLAGTAASPTVPGLAAKQDADADLTAIAGLSPSNDDVLQRKAGAWTNRTPAQLKTDLALTKTDVGLANVDNTSDAAKPVSTATQTALDAKADDSAVVHLAGAETISGNKTLTGATQITMSDAVTQAVRIDLPAGDRSSAPDTLAVYYDGSRTGYFNEFGELRVIASASNRVPLRVKQANGGGQTADLIDVTDISNNSLFTVGPTGNVSAPNLDVSSWQAVSFNTDASSNGTYATVGVRLEPLYGLGRLRGGVLVGGDGIANGETLITLPVGYRPVATFSTGVRISGSNVARQITLNTDGTVAVPSSLSVGDTVHLDGIVFPIS